MKKFIFCLFSMFIVCGAMNNVVNAEEHMSYKPRTPAGGYPAVGQSFLFDVAGAAKYDAWIRYRYTDSTDIYSITRTESTSYNSSGIPSGTTVTVEEQEYGSYNNPYDE